MAKRDNEKAAKVLVDAYLTGDMKAAEKHLITVRTVQNYRAALPRDGELSLLFAEHLRLAKRGHWADELDSSLRATISKLRELVDGIYETSPEAIKAVTEALTAQADIAITREVLSADQDNEQGQAAQAHQGGNTAEPSKHLN